MFILRSRFVRQFPKLALAGGVFLGSTALFLVWWLLRSPGARQAADDAEAARSAMRTQQAALVEERAGRLFLAGSDLYDVETGEVLFKNWLGGEPPSSVSYEPATKTFLAQFARGLVRCNADGSQRASLSFPHTVAFAKDLSYALYAKESDVWKTPIGLPELKLAEGGRVTTMGVFPEAYFAENLVLVTDETLVVRNMNNLLRVTLKTGNVTPMRMSLIDLGQRRSPDSRTVLDRQDGTLLAFDVDTSEIRQCPLGRINQKITGWLWLDNARCAVLVGNAGIAFYDLKENSLSDVTPLPVPCQHIHSLSPEGKRFLCVASRHNPAGFVFDADTKKLETLPAGAQGIGWIAADTLLFARDIPDSATRGTWIKKLTQPEMRVTEDPCVVVQDVGPLAISLREAGYIVFVTRQGLCRAKPGGTDFKVLTALEGQPPLLKAIR